MPTGLADDWQAKVKRVMVIPLIGVNVAVIVVGAVNGWLGAIVAGAAIFVLMGLIGVARFRTVHAAPALVVVVVGTVIAITEGCGGHGHRPAEPGDDSHLRLLVLTQRSATLRGVDHR